MNIPLHICWFKKSNNNLKTKDGENVEIWEFSHTDDSSVLSNWANHFRNNYMKDDLIDINMEGTSITSRKEFFEKSIFPNTKDQCSRNVRIGDFSELLVADYFEYKENFIVPRSKYEGKDNKNFSPRGTDIICFKINNPPSQNDELLSVEVKANFSIKYPQKDKLEKAIEGAVADDSCRIAESLVVMKNRFYRENKFELGKLLSRFQNLTDNPFKKETAAVAVYTEESFRDSYITNFNANLKIPMRLLVFKGKDFMKLCNKIYEIAANEA